MLFGKEKLNRWAGALLQLSRYDAKTLVALITEHSEVNKISQTQGGNGLNSRFCGAEKKTLEISSVITEYCQT